MKFLRRKVNTDNHILTFFAEMWKKEGADVYLATPYGTGYWIKIRDERSYWQAWINLHDWLAWALPELAGFAVSKTAEKRLLDWFMNEPRPLNTGINALSYNKLILIMHSVSEVTKNCDCIKVICPGGPIWVSMININTESVSRTPRIKICEENLKWPIDFIIGYTLLKPRIFKQIQSGSVIIITDVCSIVKTYTKILTSFIFLESEIRLNIMNDLSEKLVDESEKESKELVFTPVINIGSLPVKVEFVLCTELMTYTQLEKCIVIDKFLKLSEKASEKIQIRINGIIVGTGELVDIDDKIGVSIDNWFGDKDA